MENNRCAECGNTKNLRFVGDRWICKWREGCEHRQMVAKARERLHPVMEEYISEIESFLQTLPDNFGNNE